MKKVYMLIMLFAMSVAMTSCLSTESKEEKKDEIENVDAFLEKTKSYDDEKVEDYARKAVTREDFEAAHKCIDWLKSNFAYRKKENLKLQEEVYGEEVKFLLANNPDNAMAKIKFLLTDFTPSASKPGVGISGFDSHKEYDSYKMEAESYNRLLGRIVDCLLALDKNEDALKLARKGLTIPVWYGTDSIGQLVGYSNADAEAILAKVSYDVVQKVADDVEDTEKEDVMNDEESLDQKENK